MKVRTIHPLIVVPVISIKIIAAMILVFISPFPRTIRADRRVALPDSLSPLIRDSQPDANTATNQKISLSIGLYLRNQANLTSYLQQITSPSSPLYRRYLNPASFAALYGPLPQSEAAVVDYLRSQGFTITGTYANHLVVDAVGTVAQAEQTFQVQINNYRSASGHIVFSNANTPSLPISIAPLISSVSGLDDTVQYQRHPLISNASVALKQQSAVACPQPGADVTPTSYTPAQIATAYDFTRLYNQGITGDGQSVALLELDGFSPADIAAYSACFGGQHTVIQTIPIDGFKGAAGSNAAGVEADIEMVPGMAPHLCNLRVYESA